MLVIGPAHLNAATAIAGKWQGSGSWQATLFAPSVNSQETLRRQLWSIISGRTGEIKRCSGMSRTGSHFAKGVTIGRRDSKNSALNIGTNHYANMPATQGGGAGQISTSVWAKTAAPLRANFRGINRVGGEYFLRNSSAQTL